MNEQKIFDLYGIKAEQMTDGHSFTGGQYHFHILAADGMDEAEMDERYLMANHLHGKGEKGLLIPIRNREGAFFSQDEKGKILLLGLASPLKETAVAGRSLAAFHYRGQSLSERFEKLKRIGQWKSYWEQRVDQLERFWHERMVASPANDFEKLFIEIYPYFSGLSENAIQYLVDTEIDVEPRATDVATVCHERLDEQSWAKPFVGKKPLDWVFDHPTRDLAEWVRGKYFRSPNTYHHDVETFMQDYLRAIPLSAFSARLLFARLMLPVHFFETIEMYFLTKTENERKTLEDRLEADMNNTRYYEDFLRNFFDLVGIPQVKQRLNLPEWLRS